MAYRDSLTGRYQLHEWQIDVLWLTVKVVDDESSRLHDPAIETARHIGSNHMDMCRFFGTGDPQYRTVAAAIERVLQNLPTKLQPALSGWTAWNRTILVLQLSHHALGTTTRCTISVPF